jgi:hypothetical protein
MSEALEHVILALAVFRLTRLITTDVVLNRVRERIWRRFPPGNGGIGYVLTCDWCASIWVASPVYGMYKIAHVPTMFGCGVLALSAVAGLLSRVDQ